MIKKVEKVKIVECPRDAMQGIHQFISTNDKIRYINNLLKVGFHTIDFGSFVSPAAIPQLRDTAEVLEQLDLTNSVSKLLAIVANYRGALEAIKYKQISFLGFPLSLSETFQKNNTNKTIEEAFGVLDQIQSLCLNNKVTLVVYLSMGFGNPYGDEYHIDYVQDFVSRLQSLAVKIICPSDTVGIAKPETIAELFGNLIPAFPDVEFGAHLHASPVTVIEKVRSAYDVGCRRFDGAIQGFGGCPMAADDLVGNIATEKMIAFFENIEVETGLDKAQFNISYKIASEIFPAN